jgi:AcrR family transcriptional regulator
MSQDSRQRILQAAESVFSEKGYHLATVEEVAERAGVAKGTVFYNFESKAALFETVLRDGMGYLTSTVRGKLAGNEPPMEQIASIIELHVATLLENPGFIAIFSRELSHGLEDHVRATVRRARDEYVAFVAGLLEEGKRYGIVRDLDSVMLASTFFDMALSVCSYAPELPAAVSAAGRAAFLKTLILEGITARPGHREGR